MYKKDELLDLDNSAHSPHMIIPSVIIDNSVVLDVGCNKGYLGKQLLTRNIKTDGIDINKKALQKARKHYRHVYKRDLYNPNLNLYHVYDYIVFADILEHLPRPDLVLKYVRKNLKKSGLIIVSLPNIARFEIRLHLLFGHFNYNPGIMSPDHLRFFTKKSGRLLIENSGYKVERIIPTGLGHRIPILPTLTAFQFIYIATK